MAVLPAFADQIDPGEGFHVLMLFIAIPVSASALISGWRRRSTVKPLLAGLVGLLMLAGGIMFADDELIETVMTVTGSILLITAHIANWRGSSR